MAPGDPIPQSTHTVSVSLPTWECAEEYARTQWYQLQPRDTFDHGTSNDKKVSHWHYGYPREIILEPVQRLCDVLADKYAAENETCLCFPSYNVAKRCRQYLRLKSKTTPLPKVRILQLATARPQTPEEATYKHESKIAVVFAPHSEYYLLRQYWQFSGEIVSTRQAEYVLNELFMVEQYKITKQTAEDGKDLIEARFGRKTNLSHGERSKVLIKKRIVTKIVECDEEHDDVNIENHRSMENLPTLDQMVPTFLDSNSFDMFNDNENYIGPMGPLGPRIANGIQVNGIADHGRSNSSPITQALSNRSTYHSIIPAEPIEMGPPLENGTEEVTTDLNFHVRTASSNISLTSSGTPIHESSRDQQNENNSDQNAISSSNNSRKTVKIDPHKDVYLFPTGMASIFTAHRLLLYFDSRRVQRSRSLSLQEISDTIVGYGPPYKKSVAFGELNRDTLNVLTNFNHTHILQENDNISAMDGLKEILHSGEQILAVFVEAPLNTYLTLGNLMELKRLSNNYGFFIIIDETNSGYSNIDVIPFADVVCCSMTRTFTGDTNTLCGSMVVNPQSALYAFAQQYLIGEQEYEDLTWCEDVIHLERSSRDFIHRTQQINRTAEYLVENVLLPLKGTVFKNINFPKYGSNSEHRHNYELAKCKLHGGYGGIIFLTFHKLEQAIRFYNELQLLKGLSQATNYTIALPYNVVMKYPVSGSKIEGLDPTLIRICVGLESQANLVSALQKAIKLCMA